MIAAIWDTPYNIVYLVHILSIILGTGAAFLAPIMVVQVRKGGDAGPIQSVINDASASVMFPALLVAGIAGGTMVGMSQDVYDFQQTWLSVGGAIWMVVLVLVLAVYPPSYLQVITVNEQRKAMLGGLLHLSLAVMLVLMTWKYGV